MQPALVSQSTPVANFTASRRLTLEASATDHKSAIEKLPFSRGIEVVGIVVTVSLLGTPTQGRLTPTLDDIEVRVESQDLRLTRDASDDDDSDGFADATALTLPLRYTMATLSGAPDLRMQARWKNPSHATVYNDAIVTVSILYNWES